MKRDILFRGKSPKGHWIYGMPSYDLKYIFNDSNYDSHDQFEVIPETVGQFTGLTDKNGVKIFEDSDLVEMKFTIICDSFKECSFIQSNGDGSKTYKKILTLPSILTIRNPMRGYEFYNIEHDIYTPLWAKPEADVRCLEVIGNIYDNPELIKS